MSLWKNPAPDAAQPMVNTSEILTVSSAYTNHCITCAEATARAEAAEARNKVLFDVLLGLLKQCENDEAQGYKSSLRTYVIEITRQALGGEHA